MHWTSYPLHGETENIVAVNQTDRRQRFIIGVLALRYIPSRWKTSHRTYFSGANPNGDTFQPLVTLQILE